MNPDPDFDRIYQRAGTGSIKWEFSEDGGELHPRELGSDLTAPGELLCMGLADMDFPTAPAIIEALTARVKHGIFGYTMPSPAYYDAIVRWLRRRHGWHIEPGWIVTTPGVLQSINFLVQTFTQPGDRIIVQTPAFRPIANAVLNNGREMLDNPLRFENGRYLMDLDDLAVKAAAPRARMLILCSPHNPVGRVWRRETLLRLCQICHDRNLMIVSDEIHADLTYSWASFTTLGTVDPQINHRLALCYGASKAFNLPGLRTSLTIIPDDRLRGRFLTTLRNVNEHFGVNIPGTLALQTAFERGETWLDQLLAYLEANVIYLEDTLGRTAPQLRPVRPEALYLAWIDCRGLGLPPAAVHDFFLENAGVKVEPGEKFGHGGEGFIRMNIACPRIILATALDRIAAAVEKMAVG